MWRRLALMAHLLDRIQERHIGARQLELLAEWLDGEPEVPIGPWFKRFVLPGQSPKGTPVR